MNPSGPIRRLSTHLWQNALLNAVNVRWCAICIFPFLRFYNSIKGIVRIYGVSLKTLRSLFLYLLSELMYLCLKKDKYGTTKYGERIVLIFSIHCIKLEEFQSYSLPFCRFSLLVMRRISSFIL